MAIIANMLDHIKLIYKLAVKMQCPFYFYCNILMVFLLVAITPTISKVKVNVDNATDIMNTQNVQNECSLVSNNTSNACTNPWCISIRPLFKTMEDMS